MTTINGTTNNNQWTYKLEVSEDSYSIENNTSNVTVKVYLGRASSRSYVGGNWTGTVTVNGVTRNVSGTIPYPTYIDGGAWYEIKSETFTAILHNDDGSKTIGVSATMSSTVFTPSSCSASGNVTLTAIPRKAEITSAPNFNDETNPTISYSNKAGNSVTSLQARIENSAGTSAYVEYRDINKTGTLAYTFNLTEAERNTLRSACSNSNSLTVKFVIRTIIGGNTFWSTMDKTMTIVNGNPTFSSSQLSYLDSDSNIVAITGNNQHIVRNQSNLKVTFTAATAKKGASISKYEITFNSGTQTKTSATTIDYGKVNLSSNATVSVKAIDSRGNSTTISKTVQIKDWVLPSATITAGRVNNYEDETHLKANVTISSVNGKNAIQSIQYRYKKSSESNYSSYVSMSNNVQSTVSIDKLYAWDFQIAIADKFGSTTYNFTIAKGMPIMFIDINKLAVGINVFPRGDRAFDVDGNLFAPNISSNYITSYGITANGSLKSKIALSIEDSNGNEKAKLNKDGLYFSGRNILDGFKYSTSEVKTNKTWINNKPIYRKVITTTQEVINDTTISHGISNVDLIYIEKAFIINSSNNGISWTLPINLYGTTTTTIDKIGVSVDKSQVLFKCDSTWSNSWNKVIVLEYTKTTD